MCHSLNLHIADLLMIKNQNDHWKSYFMHPPCAERRLNPVTGIIADWYMYYVTLSAHLHFDPIYHSV